MKKPNILAMKPALHLGWALLFALAWQGCKDKPDPEPEVLVQDGILVLNEGNYLSGNASLSFEDAEGTVMPDVYKSASQLPLGDVAQSMALAEGDLFVVVNNSGKLLRLDLPSLDQVCAANGLLSPRHFQSISPTKAYLSDLYSRSITILNPSTCTVTGQIATGGWTEEMLVLGSKCYVAQTGTDKLLVINTTTDQLIDSIAIGRGPVSLAMDMEGKLWVLCDGGLGPEPAVLARLDPGADTVMHSWVFADAAAFPSDLRSNPAGDQIYWLNSGLWQMGIHEAALPSQAFWASNGMNFYALEIDGSTGNILVADAKDFVQKGQVVVLSPTGSELRRFNVGVNPGAILVLP